MTTNHRYRTVLLSTGLVILFFTGIAIPLRKTQAPVLRDSLSHANSTQPQVLGAQQPQKTKIIEPLSASAIPLEVVSAKSVLVYDTASDTVLVEKNAEYPLPVASLTKLMTAYVAYQHAKSDEVVFVDSAGVLNVSPALGLRAGDTVTMSDLFQSMVIGSANDSALVTADFISKKTGKKFVTLMNEAAKNLGMQNTHFSNPIGFDSDTNYSTASDFRKLVDEITKYTEFVKLGRQSSHSFVSGNGNYYKIRATNTLISDPEISSIKTGFTDEALGSMITKITRNGNSFVVIIIGSANREGDTRYLKDQIFKNFRWAER